MKATNALPTSTLATEQSGTRFRNFESAREAKKARNQFLTGHPRSVIFDDQRVTLEGHSHILCVGVVTILNKLDECGFLPPNQFSPETVD